MLTERPSSRKAPVAEAEKIYKEALHPKSFISLDDADHLLTRKPDAEYVATAIAGWASRYLPGASNPARVTAGQDKSGGD